MEVAGDRADTLPDARSGKRAPRSREQADRHLYAEVDAVRLT